MTNFVINGGSLKKEAYERAKDVDEGAAKLGTTI